MMEGPMLQVVLEERFKVKVHRETRVVPIRELVIAKGGAKLTPFKPGPGSCVPWDYSVFPPPALEAAHCAEPDGRLSAPSSRRPSRGVRR